MLKHLLIIADIEGSSGCWNYGGSSFKTLEWAKACKDMSRDVDAVVRALFDAGAAQITVKDFHRTGYNLIPGLMDPRALVIQGYHNGSIPGIGEPGSVEGVLFLGMHAASGSEGFLPHTLTSRISRFEVNGRLMSELELFAGALAPFGIQPLFFSGCETACRQAREAIPEITTFEIDKQNGPGHIQKESWRKNLASAAVTALHKTIEPYSPTGPFHAIITMRDGIKPALKLARRWKLRRQADRLYLTADSLPQLYDRMIRICYLSPLIEKILPLGLAISNLRGYSGLKWVIKALMRMKNP